MIRLICSNLIANFYLQLKNNKNGDIVFNLFVSKENKIIIKIFIKVMKNLKFIIICQLAFIIFSSQQSDIHANDINGSKIQEIDSKVQIKPKYKHRHQKQRYMRQSGTQMQLNQMNQYQQPLNENNKLPPNFRTAPKSTLPDNWDRNPFLFQTYKYI